MKTRQAALRERADVFANLGDAFARTAVKYPGSKVPIREAVRAYCAADDIREQLDGETRKQP